MAKGGVTVEVEGLKRLQGDIKKLNVKLQKRVYSTAVRKAAKEAVLKRAQAKAPKDTGALASALVSRANNKPSRYLYGQKVTVKDVYRSHRVSKRRGVGAEYKPDWVERYYRFLETGTKHHPAKPFLEPALDAGAPDFLNTLRRELKAGLERSTK